MVGHKINYVEWIKDRLKNQEVHIVASGPSLVNFNYSTLSNKNVISVNHAYKKLIQKPLWGVAVDTAFIEQEDPRAPYQITLLCKRKDPYPVIPIECNRVAYDPDPANGVYTNKCSGAAAISTALHAGAARIYLYGFDCDVTKELVHATDHEFKHRRKQRKRENRIETEKLNKHNRDSFRNMVKHFDSFPIENIINMNINSKITRFKKIAGY